MQTLVYGRKPSIMSTPYFFRLLSGHSVNGTRSCTGLLVLCL